MAWFLSLIILGIVRLALKVRYKVEVRGMDQLTPDKFRRGGGILFLPNHPTVFVDPVVVGSMLWRKFKIRPIIVEYMFYLPVVNYFMHWMRALPIPNFSESSNSFKKMRNEKAIKGLTEALSHGDNFLIYPAGRVKQTAYETLGGASAVHRILQDVPEANVVLVRVMGLWGSSFSRALTGKSVPMVPMIWEGVKTALRNFIFFTPRRKVVIEFTPAPDDFPYRADRMELNRWLEAWYNRPDDFRHLDREPEHGGESLVLVSRSFWRRDLPKITRGASDEDVEKALKNVSQETKNLVLEELSKLTGRPADELTPELSLAGDLGLDSIDAAEITAFLAERFDLKGVKNDELTTVGKVMVLAGGRESKPREFEAPKADKKTKWDKYGPDGVATVPDGNTMVEVFLRQADILGNATACADAASGILSYKDLKMRVILIAEYIRKLPGERIGILLPASVGANLLVLACQLAGKVPVMVNWTVGPRHLDTVVEASGLQQVLTSWAFLDKVEHVDFGVMDEMMVLLEDARREFSLTDKLKALWMARKDADTILKHFGMQNGDPDSHAVILFTSGTEAMPKGVPLSHYNLLTNQRDAMARAQLQRSDVVLAFLPPFHSFGFTVTGLMPLVGGIRVAYSPDPTDAERLAHDIAHWHATIIAGAPTFLMGILRGIDKAAVESVRLFVSGAEAAPAALFERIEELTGGVPLLEGYGITECSPAITINDPGEPPRGVGRTLDHTEVIIVHPETHKPIPTGESGLILVRGDSVFGGYLQKDLPSPFVEIDSEPWYNTGDLGILDADGYLTISGRLKRFIKVGGEMVGLAGLETALVNHAAEAGWELPEEGPGLAVIGQELPGEKTRLVLLTTFDLKLKQVNQALKQAGYSNIVKIAEHYKIDEIPVMGTGKTHFRKLQDMAKELQGKA